jgi:hypothetical protein
VVTTGIRPFRDGAGFRGVEVTFSQQQDPVFEIAVPVVIRSECSVVHETVVLDRATRSFTWRTGCPVESVEVDPEGMVLMRTAATPPPVLEVTGPWPNPVTTAGAEFRIYLTSGRETIVKTYDVRGRLQGESNLGSLAATGPVGETDTEPHLWTWPPAELAARLPAGVYWLEFDAAGSRAVRKLTLLK